MAPIPNQFLYREIGNVSPKKEEDVSSFLKAFEGSNAIANYTINKVMSKLYFAGMYQDLLRLGEEVVKSKNFDSIPGIFDLYKDLAMAAALTNNWPLYEIYKNKFFKLLKDMGNVDYQSMEQADNAVKIVKGEITPEEFVEHCDYSKWNLLNEYVRLSDYVIKGCFYKDTFDAADILDNWEGFPQFKERVKFLAPVSSDDD